MTVDKKTKNKWLSASNDKIKNMDFTRFLDGNNPYGEHDNSIYNGFSHGRNFHDEIVAEKLDFTGGKVLDLLSGYGRWLPSLASYNEQVVSIERIPECVKLAKNMCNYFGINNIDFMVGDICRIEELESSSFDYVWMWSGLQYVERKYALTQIQRILKPGGELFVGAYNASGLMLEHVMKGAEISSVFSGASQWALSALANGVQYDGNPNFIDPDECSELCERFGFDLIQSAPQSCLDVRNPNQQNWQNVEKVYAYYKTVEFLAKKKDIRSETIKNKVNFLKDRINMIKNKFRIIV